MSDGLHTIAGYWRNDQPGGLGIMVKDTPEALAVLRDCIMAYEEPDNEQTNAELLAQLAEFGRQSGRLSQTEQVCCPNGHQPAREPGHHQAGRAQWHDLYVD